MNLVVEKRASMLGRYIIKNKATVRKAAKQFGVSKSTVHKDVSERLKSVDPQLYKKVKVILEINKAQRHIRGGMATKQKYLINKNQNTNTDILFLKSSTNAGYCMKHKD